MKEIICAVAPEVLVVGSVHMDLIARAPRLPESGESVVGSHYALYPGGKAGNQAISAAQQGARTAIVATVGHDDFGDELGLALAQKQVDVSCLHRIDKEQTGISPVLMGDSGDYASIVIPGASRSMTPELVSGSINTLGPCKVLMIQLEIALETSAAAVSAVQKSDAMVILNASPVSSLAGFAKWNVWPDIDLLIVNLDEAATLLDIETPAGIRVMNAAVELHDRLAVPNIVVTLGGEGALVSWPGGAAVVPGHLVTVADSLGAGDAAAGALAAALARGEDLLAATKLAMAAGALAVQRVGAYHAAATLVETRALCLGLGAAFDL